MKDIDVEKIKSTFLTQQKELDPVAACLISVAIYYNRSMELSIIDKVKQFNFNLSNSYALAKIQDSASMLGFKTSIQNSNTQKLKSVEHPVLLYVQPSPDIHTCIVCYGYDKGFYIGDPNFGFTQYSEIELEAIWDSKQLITLEPDENWHTDEKSAEGKKKFYKNLILNKKVLINSIPTILFGLLLSFSILFLFEKFLANQQSFDTYKDWIITALVLVTLSAGSLLYTKNLNRFSYGIFYRIDNYAKNGQLANTHPDYCFGQVFNFANFSHIYSLSRSIALFASLYLPLMVYLLANAFRINIWLFVFFGVEITAVLLYYSLSPNKILKFSIQFIKHIYGHMAMLSYSDNNLPIFRSIGKELYVNQHSTRNSNRFFNAFIKLDRKKTLLYTYFSLFNLLALLVVLFIYNDNCLICGKEGIFRFLVVAAIHFFLVQLINSLLAYRELKQYCFNIFDMYPKVFKPAEAAKPQKRESMDTICFMDINSTNPDGTPTFKENVSMELRKNQITHILGKNLGGKTNFIDILTRKNTLFKGSVLVNGKNWKEIGDQQWKTQAHFLGRATPLVYGNVFENICLDNFLGKEDKLVQFCKKTGLHKYIEALPMGYYTFLNNELGGNVPWLVQRFIGFARLVYHQPQFIILDDPFNGLDAKSRTVVRNLLEKIKPHVLILIFSAIPDGYEEIASHSCILDQNGLLEVSKNAKPGN